MGFKTWIVPFRRCGAAILLLWMAFAPGDVEAQAPSSFDPNKTSTFYRSPDPKYVADLIGFYNAQPDKVTSNGVPPLIGFLGEAIRRYPKETDHWANSITERRLVMIFAYALALSGDLDRAVKYMRARGENVPTIEAVKGAAATSAEKMQINGPNQLDILWGSFFASGNLAYVDRIVTFASSVIADPTIDTDEVMFFGGINPANPATQPIAKRVGTKYNERGPQALGKFLSGGVALWAIGSNAAQHDVIRTHLTRQIDAKPTDPAMIAVRRMMFRTANPGKMPNVSAGENGLIAYASFDKRYSMSLDLPEKYGQEISFINMSEQKLGGPIHVTVLFKLPPNGAAQAHLTLLDPSGAARTLKPLSASTKEKMAIVAHAVTITPEELTARGSYRVQVEGLFQNAQPLRLEVPFLIY